MQMIDNYNFAGEKAIIRVDFNVPLGAQNEVSDDTRIRGALPTIKKVLKDGGSAILMSHLGRPKSGPEEKFSLKHVMHFRISLDWKFNLPTIVWAKRPFQNRLP